MAMGYDYIMVRLAACSMLLFAVGCSNEVIDRMPNYMQEWDGVYPDSVHIDVPTTNELPRLKALAYSGSTAAALSVMLFYANDDDNDFMQCYWAGIAAQNGGRDGLFNAATCYETESYYFYSPIRAKFWYERGAIIGDEGSHRRSEALRHIKINADAISANDRPVFWNLRTYENAAYSGSASAAILLARHYEDDEKACYWYSIAAENGGKEAWRALSKCYADRSSWRFSPHREKFWLSKAGQV